MCSVFIFFLQDPEVSILRVFSKKVPMLTHYSRVLKVFPTATCLNLKVLHFGNCFVERSPGMYSFFFWKEQTGFYFISVTVLFCDLVYVSFFLGTSFSSLWNQWTELPILGSSFYLSSFNRSLALFLVQSLISLFKKTAWKYS